MFHRFLPLILLTAALAVSGCGTSNRLDEVSLDGRRVVLVDDVVYTGRTTRAALDALIDMGRPASVRLLAFVDRGLRELPVAPDYVGLNVPTAPGELVRVRLDEEDGEDGVWLVKRENVEG